VSHGGVVPFHNDDERRPGCPWCSTANVAKSVTQLRRALGQALQLLVAYNTDHPGIYSAETWKEVQLEAVRTNLMTGIHDPEMQARLDNEKGTG
jgi:hypothetical protein